MVLNINYHFQIERGNKSNCKLDNSNCKLDNSNCKLDKETVVGYPPERDSKMEKE